MEIGALDHFPLEQGTRYRARLDLHGLYSFAGRGDVEDKLKEKGFSNVIVRKASELPSDWTDRAKADWYLEGTWSKPSVTANLQDDSNAEWLAAWKYQPEAAKPSIPIIKPPTGNNPDVVARENLLKAWPKYGPLPSLAELQITQAVGRLETFYGLADPFKGSNNWGAIHTSANDPDSFAGKDSDPLAGKDYETRFKKYATPEDGALGLIKVTHKTDAERRAFATGSIDNVAEAMYDASYYGVGFRKATPTERAKLILNYTKALANGVAAIAVANKEKVEAFRSGEAEGKLITKSNWENDKIAAVSTLALGTLLPIGAMIFKSKRLEPWHDERTQSVRISF